MERLKGEEERVGKEHKLKEKKLHKHKSLVYILCNTIISNTLLQALVPIYDLPLAISSTWFARTYASFCFHLPME